MDAVKKLKQIKEERAIQDRSCVFSEDTIELKKLSELKPRRWEGGTWYSGREGVLQAEGADCGGLRQERAWLCGDDRK